MALQKGTSHDLSLIHIFINHICEIISEKEPAPEGEAIILVNGFEQLKYYAELAYALEKQYKGSKYNINIKFAKRKWEELSSNNALSLIHIFIYFLS